MSEKTLDKLGQQCAQAFFAVPWRPEWGYQCDENRVDVDECWKAAALAVQPVELVRKLKEQIDALIEFGSREWDAADQLTVSAEAYLAQFEPPKE